jgi:thymidylate synthase (FAD)
MKLIKQSYEILNNNNSLKDIELAARTCYQSFDKISEDDSSAIKLVTNLVERKHYAMLEFGENIILNVDKELLIELLNYAHKPFYKGFNITVSNTRYLLSFNPRTAIEFLEYIDYLSLYIYYVKDNCIRKLCRSIKNNLPTLLTSKFDWINGNDWYPVLGQKSLVSKLERNVHETLTVKFTTSRSISHELVRHRICSFAQKSTRYCDEKGEIEFIEPCWLENSTLIPRHWFPKGLFNVEKIYQTLRRHNWKPEQAREVLPNALATEIVVKASLQEWKHIFSLRCDKAAHPMMQDLMNPLQKEFNQLYDVV